MNRGLKIQDILDSNSYENVSMYKYRVHSSLYRASSRCLEK